MNIYDRYTYPNPPIMALLLMPLAHLSPMFCSLSWFFLKVGMAYVALVWVFRLVESPGQPFPLGAKIIVMLLALRPIMGDLSHGNVNLFILFLVVGALTVWQRGHDVTAGVVLALAVACKVTPALLIPYFAWKRSWRTLAGAGIGLAFFLWIVPGCFLGMERNHELLKSWYRCMVQPYVVQGEVTTEHINQSLPGLAYRLLTHSPSYYDKGIPKGFSNIYAWDPVWIRLLLKLFMAGFAGLIVWTCRAPTQSRVGWPLAAEFSLVLLGMLLFSERTWKHHCVTLVLPFAVLVYFTTCCTHTSIERAVLVASLVAAEALMLTTISGVQDQWTSVAKTAEAAGAYVWAFVILTAAVTWILRCRGSAQPEPALPATRMAA
jgi:hypothetical protein